MENKTDYLILDSKSLIIESYVGNFSVDELIEFKKKVGNDEFYNPNYNVIHDFREIDFRFGPEEISKYISLISKNNKLLGIRKSAMITKTPNQVVTTMQFDVMKDRLPIKVEICSTLNCAFNFIDLPKEDWKFIESLIVSLKDKIGIDIKKKSLKEDY